MSLINSLSLELFCAITITSIACGDVARAATVPIATSFCEVERSPRDFEYKEVSLVATVEGFPKFAMALHDDCASGFIGLIVPTEMENDKAVAKLRSILFPRYEQDLDDIGRQARIRVTGEFYRERHRDVLSRLLLLHKVEILEQNARD